MDGWALTQTLTDARASRVAARLSQSAYLAGPLRRLGYDSGEMWAWDNYKLTVLAFVEQLRQSGRHDGSGRVRLLEVGGGRGPSFEPGEAEALGIALTVNDIDARELSLAPKGFATACFNVADAVDPALSGQFDLVFSRMVFEHVANAPRAWANVARLLETGGVAFAFHPTLYSPAFVVNWLIPEALSARILRALFPWRNDGEYPKFPARYEMCFGEPRAVVPKLRLAGFSEALIAPFFGTRYLRAIPLARDLERELNTAAERNDWRWLSAYAYTLARK